jgi:membrane glycosyltransferase
MHGDTLVALVRLMEQNPSAGLVQTLPQGAGHGTLHARAQQFGNRVSGRLFALGMAYWQLGESHYWGHNAILRVAPFMRSCGLARLPGRGGLAGEILSHDFVEAAMMRRAGFEVWLAPQLGGSWEQHPSNLLEELQRDRRWCQGNLQNARLLAEPGWRPVHRAMLALGALSYLMAPIWLCAVATGLWLGAVTSSSTALWVLTLLLLCLPRVLGVLAVQLRREQASFGGSLRLWCSATLELLLSALQAPVRMLAHSVFVVVALTGLRLDWKSPSRAAAAVAWRDALARIGTLALPALALLVLALHGSDLQAPHLLPLLVPLLLAVPFTVWTGGPFLCRMLHRTGLLSVPEDRHPSRALLRGAQHHGFGDLAPVAATAMRLPPTAARRPVAMAMATAACLVALVLPPRTALTPGLSAELRDAAYAAALLQSVPQDLGPPRSARVAAASADRPQRTVRYRPASQIDDAVRRRAYEAVARSLDLENS